MVLTEYTYVFAIGTFFAMLDAFNNGASKYYQHFLTVGYTYIHAVTDSHGRRCCKRLGDQCLVEVHHLPTGHGFRYHL